MEELNGYTPPASLNLSDFQDAIGDAVVQAIIKIGIRVNREELLKALNYDRGQYKAGYDAGFADGFIETLHTVRCRECKFWMPEHIERDDGSIMLYEQLPWMEPGMAPIEFGVNVGSYCTLCENVITHGFRDGNPSLDCTRLWRREDDYCSRGQRRDQSADVRNMGQFAGGGKMDGGSNERP